LQHEMGIYYYGLFYHYPQHLCFDAIHFFVTMWVDCFTC
jgi:hypothetical protein